jgi:hypothetical protein
VWLDLMKRTLDTNNNKTTGVIITGQYILTKLVDRYSNTEIDSIFKAYQEKCLITNNYREYLITENAKQLCNIECLDYVQLTKTNTQTNVNNVTTKTDNRLQIKTHPNLIL